MFFLGFPIWKASTMGVGLRGQRVEEATWVRFFPLEALSVGTRLSGSLRRGGRSPYLPALFWLQHVQRRSGALMNFLLTASVAPRNFSWVYFVSLDLSPMRIGLSPNQRKAIVGVVKKGSASLQRIGNQPFFVFQYLWLSQGPEVSQNLHMQYFQRICSSQPISPNQLLHAPRGRYCRPSARLVHSFRERRVKSCDHRRMVSATPCSTPSVPQVLVPALAKCPRLRSLRMEG